MDHTPTRRIILHIGWPKTGTSTLQKHVFPQLPGHRYLGKAPFEGEKNRFFFDLVHLLAYCSQEKFVRMAPQMLHALHALEVERHGQVDAAVPLILSEEGVLSSLLKPSHHQHHGYSTASLQGIIQRLRALEAEWNVAFEILITERDPAGLLHSYYAQMYHVFSRMAGLGSFQRYVEAGVRDMPSADLGFHYLRPGLVVDRFAQVFGADHVHSIHMKDLFTADRVHLSRWYAPFADVVLPAPTVENKRSVGGSAKVTHLRPIWAPRKPFRPLAFLRQVRNLYRMEHAAHDQLEVRVEITGRDRELLQEYFKGTDAA